MEILLIYMVLIGWVAYIIALMYPRRRKTRTLRQRRIRLRNLNDMGYLRYQYR